MTTKDLFRCIGNLSDGMIEEAADIRRKPRWLPIAALAACAVLAISIPLAVRSMSNTKSASSAAETPAAEADSAVGATESPREPEASGGWDDGDAAARILATEIGGLRLGMTEAEVASLHDGPDSFSNSGAVERGDGLQEICWFYNTSGSADVLYDASLTLVGDDVRDGPDAVLCSIWVTSPSTWTLDTGIGIGSPQEAVDAAYPDAAFAPGSAENTWIYSYTAGDLYLRILVTDGEVSSIDLGGLNEYHLPDEEKPAPADPYTFTPYDTLSGGTVTAYTRTEDGWTQQVLTEKRAKLLVTAFNIMDPEPGDTQGEPIVWLVFESGGVAALYDETGAGAIYRLEDPSAFEAALAANEDPSPALTLIESCVFPDVWDNVQQALEQ
ncbi:MAG: hypothetical protein ACLSDS_09900 [Oscillospiraceae bacterium]